jgi:iron complex transport system substrate-binding protein
VSAGRIVSLVPGATETLFALGVGDRLRAVSHACDHPPEVEALPAASRARVDPDVDSRELDEQVRERREDGEPMFDVLGEVIHHAQPDLVVTQQACEVCGVTPVDVKAKLARFEPVDQPQILPLDPHTLSDVLDDVRDLAEAVGVPDAGEALVAELQERIRAVEAFAAERGQRPRVAVLDWLDPPMAAGHWVPDMIEAAGGEPSLVDAGEASRYVDWEEVQAAEPEVLVLAPCGFGPERTRKAAAALRDREGWDELPAVQSGRVFALDAGAYTSRPGPRLVDGIEQLACALHGAPARERWPEQATRVQRLGRRA